MKAVLMSIQPQWCEKIVKKEKTIEVRKTKPNLEGPFKVYIYCSKSRPYLNQHNNSYYLEEKDILGERGLGHYRRLNGQVIGEFTCNKIYQFSYSEMFAPPDWQESLGMQYYITSGELTQTCLTYDQMVEYGNGKTLYGWEISDLVMYETPKRLSDFYHIGAKDMNDLDDQELCNYCADTEYGDVREVLTPTGMHYCEGRWCSNAYDLYLDENYQLSSPPQSWCYIDDSLTIMRDGIRT